MWTSGAREQDRRNGVNATWHLQLGGGHHKPLGEAAEALGSGWGYHPRLWLFRQFNLSAALSSLYMSELLIGYTRASHTCGANSLGWKNQRLTQEQSQGMGEVITWAPNTPIMTMRIALQRLGKQTG